MDLYKQILEAFKHLREAHFFIREYKIWRGYFEKGWKQSLTIAIGMIVGIMFIRDILYSLEHISNNNIKDPVSGIALVAKNIYYDGGIKYLLLILIQMILFHTSHRTLEILNGTSNKTDFKDFYKAQVRGIKLAIRNYFMEIITGTVIQVLLGILILSSLKPIALILVQFYFVGYTFMDIYFYQGGLRVRETSKYIRHHAAAAIIFGAFGYVLFLIPLAGIIIAPLICGVAATTYLFYNTGWTDEGAVILDKGQLAVD